MGVVLIRTTTKYKNQKDGEKQGFLYLQESHIHELRGRDRSAPDGVLEEKDLSPIDNHLQIKIEFLPRESHWGNKVLLQVGCIPSSRQLTKTHSMACLEFFCLIMPCEGSLFKNFFIFSSLPLPSGPLCLFYDVQFSICMKFLSRQTNVSLILVPSLGLFFFCLFVQF